MHRHRKEGAGEADRRHDQRLADQVDSGGVFARLRGTGEISHDETVDDAGYRDQRQRQGERQSADRKLQQPGPVERQCDAAPDVSREDERGEQVGECRGGEQENAAFSEHGEGEAETRNQHRTDHGRLHHREGLQPGAQQFLEDFVIAQGKRKANGGRRGQGGEADQARDDIGRGPDRAGQDEAGQHEPAHVAAVAAGLFAHDGQAQPARQEHADHCGKTGAEDVYAIFGRREVAREHDDIEQPEGRRKHVRQEVDRGLAYEHVVVPAAASTSARTELRLRVTGAGSAAWAESAARMTCTGVSDIELTETAT